MLHALDQVLDRPVGLEELFSHSDGMRQRFIREALGELWFDDAQ